MIETARLVLEAMVQEVTGVQVLSLHHDISTVNGEEVVIFALSPWAIRLSSAKLRSIRLLGTICGLSQPLDLRGKP